MWLWSVKRREILNFFMVMVCVIAWTEVLVIEFELWEFGRKGIVRDGCCLLVLYLLRVFWNLCKLEKIFFCGWVKVFDY